MFKVVKLDKHGNVVGVLDREYKHKMHAGKKIKFLQTQTPDATYEIRDMAELELASVGTPGSPTVIPENFVHMMRHSAAKNQWYNLCVKKYGQKAVELALA